MQTQANSTKSTRAQRRAAKANKGVNDTVDITQKIKDAIDGKLDPKDVAAEFAQQATEEQTSETRHNDASAQGDASAGDASSAQADASSAQRDASSTEENVNADASNTTQQEDTSSTDAGAQPNDTSSGDDGPSVDDIGKNNAGKRRGPTGPRTGANAGAKPLIRALLGTLMSDGERPEYTLDEICNATKKSEVNVRTILSDLRSAKYAGGDGVFMTESVKRGDKTFYRMTTDEFHKRRRVNEADRRVEALSFEVEQRANNGRRATDIKEEPSPDDAVDTPTDAEVDESNAAQQ